MKNWRKWADERNLMYDSRTGEIRKARSRQGPAADGHFWIFSDGYSVSPTGNDMLCAKVRANVLKLMAKEAKRE